MAAAIGAQSIKDGLRAAHEQAVSLGVFGVPTVFIDGELFWGDDRLDEATARRS